jgi:hypothetical protein
MKMLKACSSNTAHSVDAGFNARRLTSVYSAAKEEV